MSGAGFNPPNDSTIQPVCFDLQEAPQWLLIVHSICVGTIIVASLVGNGLVLLLAAKYKELRCHAMIASLSVVAVDLLLNISFHLPALVSTVAKGWLFRDTGCKVFGFMAYEFLITRLLIMAALCTDRFCTVRFPFSYKKYGKCVLVLLTLVAWILPFVLAIPVVVEGFGGVGFRGNIPTCTVNCQGNHEVCKAYFRDSFFISIVIGGIIPVVLYIWMWHRARKLRPTAVMLGIFSAQVASGPIVSTPLPQLEHNSFETRAFVTFSLIFVTVLVTALPSYIFVVLRTISLELWCKVPLIVQFIGAEIFFLATALDPVLILRDRDFRRCLSELCCCCSKRDLHLSTEQYVHDSPNSNKTPLSKSGSFASDSGAKRSISTDVCRSESDSSLGHISNSPPKIHHEESTFV